MKPTWIITGATSVIAEEFAHLVAELGHRLLLVGRHLAQLKVIASDIHLRYHVDCDVLEMDFSDPALDVSVLFPDDSSNLNLFIAHSDFTSNQHLTNTTITDAVNTNILATIKLITTYLNHPQNEHNLMFISSVAACRGRAKNSLYGAAKGTIEIFLEGLQQATPKSQHLCIARLGFIDTKQTWGVPGVFYAAPPKTCAKACLKAFQKHKKRIYYPKFWRIIMGIIKALPFGLYRLLKNT